MNDMQSVFAWSETGPLRGISFSAAHSLVCKARIVMVAPVIVPALESTGIPECISRIIMDYLPPGRLEFAQFCYFAEYISNAIIVPIDIIPSDLGDVSKRFHVVTPDAFDDVKSMILKIPFWDKNDPDSEQLDYIDAITVPYFEKVFAGHADAASQNLDDLKPFWHSSRHQFDWADECHWIASMAAKN